MILFWAAVVGLALQSLSTGIHKKYYTRDRGWTEHVALVVGEIIGSNCVVTKEVENGSYCCYVRCATKIVGGMILPINRRNSLQCTVRTSQIKVMQSKGTSGWCSGFSRWKYIYKFYALNFIWNAVLLRLKIYNMQFFNNLNWH